MSLAVGTRFGVFEVTGSLGAGGMGEVYRARDAKLNRDVAIKVLLSSVANDPDRLARFSREAQVLASLNHPNIAQIFGIEESAAVTALVMELVEGEDLSRRIARGPIPLDEALPIARQIAEALEAAHDHGIIHRDLKPANIKLRSDGIVKVLDFGLAKAIDPAAGSSATAMNSPTLSIHATHAGVILGTAAYMSPEQARGKVVDKRADIWAFGAVLFEMLTGKRAFPGDDATDTIIAVVSKEPNWSALPPTPTHVARLLRRCLQKDTRQRLDSAAAVRLDLDGDPSPLPAVSHRPDVWRVVAGVLALALAVVFVYPRSATPVPPLARFQIASPNNFIRPIGSRFALAPDGQRIAFRSIAADGIARLYTRRLDQIVAQQVAGTEDGIAPFWSPDGRSLAFARDGGLYRTELEGVAPRRLCDSGDADGRNLSSGTWGTKGKIVFATASGLWQVPETGGTPLAVTVANPSALSHVAPSFLPDGQRLLFLELATGQIHGTVWVAAIDNPERTRITESSGGAAYAMGWLLTTSEGARNLVAQPFDLQRLTIGGPVQTVRDGVGFGDTSGEPGFSVSDSGTLAVDRPVPIIHQFVWRDRAGNTLGTVGPQGDFRESRLAPDERRIVSTRFDREAGKRDLWLFDSERGDGVRLTFQAVASRPMWSRDGSRIYFTEAPSFRLRSRAIAATESRDVENPGQFIHFEDITKDGRFFVLKSPGRFSTIWIQRVGDPNERRLVARDPFGVAQARVSPDGRWLAYRAGRGQIYIQPFDRPGDRIAVSTENSSGPVWRADGRELFFESGRTLMAIAVAERAGAPVADQPRALFAIRTQGSVTNQPHNVEAAANGQKFLVNTVIGDSDNAPIEVTLNWTAGLKK